MIRCNCIRLFLILCPLVVISCASIKERASKQVTSMVTAHRYGFDASVNFNTDRIFPETFEPFEAAFMKYNIGFTAFVSKVDNASKYSDEGKKEIHASGRGAIELYFRTDKWINPESKKMESIPDYYATNWSIAGAKKLKSKKTGIKPARYPNHGQEMYEVSNGFFGLDTVTNKTGKNNLEEFFPYFYSEKKYIEAIRNNSPLVALSYGNGQTGCLPILEEYKLVYGGRNSIFSKDSSMSSVSYYGRINGKDLGHNPTKLNESKNHSISRENTTRFLSMAISNRKIDPSKFPNALDFCLNSLELALNKNGFYNSFAHWNYFYGSTSPYTQKDHRADFIKLIQQTREKIDTLGVEVYSESYGEIVSYYIARSVIASTKVHKKRSELILSIDLKKEEPFDLNLLNSPVSIKIDVSNSRKFRGRDITSASNRVLGIRKIEENKFVLDIDLQKSKSSFQITIQKTKKPEYLNFDQPNIIEYNLRDSSYSIKTSQKTNVVLYFSNDNNLASLRVLKRSNTNEYEHTIDLKRNNLNMSIEQILKGKVHAGIISSGTKQSSLIAL